jgi:hypothetical protein
VFIVLVDVFIVDAKDGIFNLVEQITGISSFLPTKS